MDIGRTKQPPGRVRGFPPRSLSQLMTVVALSGLAMAALVPRGGGRSFAPQRRLAPPPRLWSFPAPASPRGEAYDRFVITAPEGLDPGIVVAAPEGIDDRMIAAPAGVQSPAPRVWPFPVLPPQGR